MRSAAAVGRAAYQHAREAAAGDAAAKRAMFADVSRPSPEPLYLSITPPRSFLIHCSSPFRFGRHHWHARERGTDSMSCLGGRQLPMSTWTLR